MKQELAIDVSHSQFYIEDEYSNAVTGAMWTDRAITDRIATAPGLIAISTERFGGNARLLIEVREARPAESSDAWDHIVECGLAAPSGMLRVSSPEMIDRTTMPRVPVPSGAYCVLVCYGNLYSVTDESVLEGDDYYRVVLWPGKVAAPKVLKRDLRRYEAQIRRLRSMGRSL